MRERDGEEERGTEREEEKERETEIVGGREGGREGAIGRERESGGRFGEGGREEHQPIIRNGFRRVMQQNQRHFSVAWQWQSVSKPSLQRLRAITLRVYAPTHAHAPTRVHPTRVHAYTRPTRVHA